MTKKLTLVVDNSPTKPEPWVPAEKTHLDVAIENMYLMDIVAIIIAPNESHEGGTQLSLKCTIEGSDCPLWINLTGPKHYCVQQALRGVESIFTNYGIPKRPEDLLHWQKVIKEFGSNTAKSLLILPE